MNGRAMYRKFAQSNGKEAKEFVEIRKNGYGASDELITKNNKGQIETTSLDYEDVVIFMIKNY